MECFNDLPNYSPPPIINGSPVIKSRALKPSRHQSPRDLIVICFVGTIGIYAMFYQATVFSRVTYGDPGITASTDVIRTIWQ
jgi:hypothetical protein